MSNIMGFIENEKGMLVGVTYHNNVQNSQEDIESKKLEQTASIVFNRIVESGILSKVINTEYLCKIVLDSGIIQKEIREELEKNKQNRKSLFSKVVGIIKGDRCNGKILG